MTPRTTVMGVLMFTARFTTEVLRLAGYPVLLHRVYIDLPKVRLEVAAAEAYRCHRLVA